MSMSFHTNVYKTSSWVCFWKEPLD